MVSADHQCLEPLVLVVTRFNLSHSAWHANGEPVGLDPGWLSRRMLLFSNFCVPSMVGQTYRGFVWLVLVDPRTPAAYRSRIEELVSCVPNAEVLDCASASAVDREVEKSIRKRRRPGASILSIRLDNDDALCLKAISELVHALSEHREEFVHLPDGLIFNARTGRAFRHHYRRGPFLARRGVLPETGPFRTVYSDQHEHVHGPGVRQHGVGRMFWAQIVHVDNLANRVQGFPLASDGWKAEFGIPRSPLSERSSLLVRYPLALVWFVIARIARRLGRRGSS